MTMVLNCAGRVLDLAKPRVMGILNITPDSFSDGGNFLGNDKALRHAIEMVTAGADIIDIGGESTRPGAEEVSEQEELDRVIPLIEAISSEIDLPISIDTSKAAVMREAVAAGAGLINDVNALRAPGALEIAAVTDVPICLMHMQGAPRTMQANPQYNNVVDNVADFLLTQVDKCEAAGISRERIIIDPGFGFGKSLQHNIDLFNELPRFVSLGMPVLVGVSRKTMIGTILDAPVDQRKEGGIALASLALWWGVKIIRTHDVKATVDAVKICQALKQK